MVSDIPTSRSGLTEVTRTLTILLGILRGVLQPGESAVFRANAGLRPVLLPNKGGVLTVLDPNGAQIDRVDCTEGDLKQAGGSPVFFPAYRPQSHHPR